MRVSKEPKPQVEEEVGVVMFFKTTGPIKFLFSYKLQTSLEIIAITTL